MPRSNATTLTDVVARTAKAPNPGPAGQVTRRDLWDSIVTGLGLRISSTGKRSWVLGARVLVDGRHVYTRVVIGFAPAMGVAEAREKARRAKEDISRGIDPRAARKHEKAERVDASRHTFARLVERFMAEYVKREKLRESSAKDYRSSLQGSHVTDWAARPVVGLTWTEIDGKLESLISPPAGSKREAAPYAARHLFASLRRFFGWLVAKGIIASSPLAGKELPSGCRPVDRERWLSPSELREVWAAAHALTFRDSKRSRGDLFGPLIKLLILTGQRRDEVAGMMWSELTGLDGPAPLWEIAAARAKNEKAHKVPLSPPAAKLIARMPRTGSPFVFSTGRRTSESSAPSYVSGFSKAKIALDAAIATARSESEVEEDMPPFVFHDLRRTVATLMGDELRIKPHIIEAVLNHQSGYKAGIVKVYQKAEYLDEKREALNLWANYIKALVMPSTQE